jgi:intracellular septation protein A
MDKNTFLLIIFCAAVLYMYYSAIMGIIKRKFSAFMIAAILGMRASEVGPENIFRKFENEQAITAAIVQLWMAFVFTLAIVGSIFELFFRNDIFVPIFGISTIIAVFLIIRISYKYRKLKKQKASSNE